MTYFLTSNGPAIGEVILIKVPTRSPDNHPYVGFKSEDLARKYLDYRNVGSDDISISTDEELVGKLEKTRDIFLFSNEQQFLDIAKNSEGYDYEEYIVSNDA